MPFPRGERIGLLKERESANKLAALQTPGNDQAYSHPDTHRKLPGDGLSALTLWRRQSKGAANLTHGFIADAAAVSASALSGTGSYL